MHQTYLLLGSNMSNCSQQLLDAKQFIVKHIGSILKESSCYQTAPWGIPDQPDFLNQVLLVATKLPAAEVMNAILDVEKKMGRIRAEKNGPRIIDIDILFFDEEISETSSLTLPHPSLHKRRFTLVPINEISPDLIHPVLKKTVKSLLQDCTDNLEVKKI